MVCPAGWEEGGSFARSLARSPCVTPSLSLCAPSSSTLCMTISLKERPRVASSNRKNRDPRYISAVLFFRDLSREVDSSPFRFPKLVRRLGEEKNRQRRMTTSVNLPPILSLSSCKSFGNQTAVRAALALIYPLVYLFSPPPPSVAPCIFSQRSTNIALNLSSYRPSFINSV